MTTNADKLKEVVVILKEAKEILSPECARAIRTLICGYQLLVNNQISGNDAKVEALDAMKRSLLEKSRELSIIDSCLSEYFWEKSIPGFDDDIPF